MDLPPILRGDHDVAVSEYDLLHFTTWNCLKILEWCMFSCMVVVAAAAIVVVVLVVVGGSCSSSNSINWSSIIVRVIIILQS